MRKGCEKGVVAGGGGGRRGTEARKRLGQFVKKRKAGISKKRSRKYC